MPRLGLDHTCIHAQATGPAVTHARTLPPSPPSGAPCARLKSQALSLSRLRGRDAMKSKRDKRDAVSTLNLYRIHILLYMLTVNCICRTAAQFCYM